MTSNKPGAGLILISNKMNLHDYIRDSRVRSRLSPLALDVSSI